MNNNEMKKQSIAFISVVAMFTCLMVFPLLVSAQSPDETAVRQLLEKQRQAWNKGNLEEFMKGYWESDSLVFIGKNGPKYGYKTTLENYRKGYPDTTAMGQLTFDILSIKRLSFQYFYVIGKWTLNRTADNLSGHFTLLVKKIKNKWVVVSDHSS
jgi:ketosteroid isomerase-like protein